jgi:hypothetical protein
MVQPVSREEEHARRYDSVFAERNAEMDELASKMPKRLAEQFPYLMEINTGFVHPYTEAMAARSDLVIGCYNLAGSRNPDDADPYYNPQALVMRNERAKRVESVGPRSAADAKAAAAEEEGRIRREERAKLELENEAYLAAERERIKAELLAETAPAPFVDDSVGDSAEKGKVTKGRKGKKVTDATSAEPVVAEQVPDTPAPAIDEGGGVDDTESDLNAAFQEAMQ